MPGALSLVSQLDDVIDQAAGWAEAGRDDDFSSVPAGVREELTTRCLAVIDRIARPGSPYLARVEEVLSKDWNLGYKLSCLLGIVAALRADMAAGYLLAVTELIHGETFADFLEMSGYLLEEGCKDAAAVIAGSTLEAHLRALCHKTELPVERASSDGAKPRKAETLNADLAKARAYSKLDQKSATAWLGLRNNAAHGDYAAYGAEQVLLLISGVREFVARVPA